MKFITFLILSIYSFIFLNVLEVNAMTSRSSAELPVFRCCGCKKAVKLQDTMLHHAPGKTSLFCLECYENLSREGFEKEEACAAEEIDLIHVGQSHDSSELAVVEPISPVQSIVMVYCVRCSASVFYSGENIPEVPSCADCFEYAQRCPYLGYCIGCKAFATLNWLDKCHYCLYHGR